MAAAVKERNSSNITGKDADIDSVDDSMAKGKAKKEAKEKKPKKKKKGSSALVPILILLVIIGAIAAVIYFDLFGVRTNYLSGVLSKIPIVSSLLPPEETPAADGGSTGMTLEQMNAKIAELTSQNEAYAKQISDQNDKINLYVEEIDRLRAFEDQQLQFKADKTAFDEMIANSDPKAFSSFYESVNPETAKEVYAQWVVDRQKSKEIQAYVETYTQMSAKAAAAIFEEMIRTDIDTIILILKNMDSEYSGPIVGAMTAKNAATITKRMSP